MSYSHHWLRPRVLPQDVFDRIAVGFIRLLPALEAAGVELAGEEGQGQPLLCSGAVKFNGVRDCGHPLFPALPAAPLISAHGFGDEGRRCDGSCAGEPFVFPRLATGRAGSCVTNFRPYDLAVCCALLIAKHHLGDEIQVCTGGTAAQWNEARELCDRVLGYGAEFVIEEHVLSEKEPK